MRLIHAFLSLPSAHSLFWVSPMPCTLRHTMLEAHFLNSSLRDSEAQQHLLTLLEVVVLQELYQGVCKLYRMFLNQLVETMVIPTITAVLIVATRLLATIMDSHMRKANLRNSNLLYRCITVDRLLSEATEELDPSNHIKQVLLVHNHTLALQYSRCRVWFPDNH
jgi:hypothetical protein